MVGDLDANGVADLAVGAFGDDTGGSGRGATHVLLLNANGTVKSSVKVASGTNGGPTLADGDSFGRSVTSLGDLNGDGLTDLAVGAFFDNTNGTDRGAVHVLFLKAQSFTDFGDAPDTSSGTGTNNYQTLLANNGPSHEIFSTRTTLFLGDSVDGDSGTLQNVTSNADDVDGADDEDGALFPAGDLIGTIGAAPTVTLQVTNTTGSAATLAGWIDYEHDGVFETAERTTATVPNGTTDGRVTLTFPAIPSGFTGTTYARFRLSTDDGFTADPSPAGALSDGEVEDYTFAITSPSTGTADSFTKIADSTGGGSTLADFDAFGHSVTSLGDLDGDGVADLAVGADGDDMGSSSSGAVHVLRLNANGTVKSSTKIASGTGGGPTLSDLDFFGFSVAGVGDLDGDGVADLAVGERNDYTGGYARGAVHVLLLNTNGTVKSSTKVASGTGGGPTLRNGDFFGSSLSSLGDLDGDGVTDLAVGAYGDDGDGTNRGAVYVLLLNADGTVKTSTKIASGTGGGPTLATNDFFGSSVSGVGDLDGDGVADLAVGAREDDTGGANRGAVHVLRLNVDGSVKSSTKIAGGTGGGPTLANNHFFGSSVSSVGDLDGDGVADLAVGATGDDTDGSDRGAVHVLLLNADGTVKSSTKIASGTGGGPTLADGDLFGSSMSGVGDLNGDGVVDLAIGAYRDDTGGTNRGAVHILFLKESSAKTITLPDGGGSYEILVDSGDLVVRVSGGAELLRQAAEFVSKLTIHGSSGNDVVTVFNTGTSLTVPLVMNGGDGNDTLNAAVAGTGVALNGDGGADSLTGSALADVLDGGLGSDTLTGGTGADTLAGGAGTGDTLSESTLTNLSLSPTQLSIGQPGATEVDTLSGIEKALLFGGGAANVMDASAAAIPVTMFGGGGNDSLIGSSQADNIDGQGGNDTLTGGVGNDTLNGGTGTDGFRDVAYTDVATGLIRFVTLTNSSLIVVQNGATLSNDSLLGFEFADLTGGTARDIISASGFTNTGVTTISGGGGNDVITGTPGADMIFTLTGADSINGGSGGDTVFAGSGSDTVNGGDGADNLNGQNGDDSILGDADNDVLVGGAGVDTLTGGLGNDFLSGQTDAGLLNGGEGNDTLQGNTASDTLNGDAGDDRLFALQGDDVINAGDGADSLVGAIGNDSLNGGVGQDTLQGDLGNDTLDGGADFDRINEVFDTNVTISGITVTTAGLGSDTVLAIERIQISGGPAANFFDGRQATVPVFLSGGLGNDTLLGGSKGDGVLGNEGDDVLSGGAGVDIIDGGEGTDYVLEKADTNFTVNGATLGTSATIMSAATGTDSPSNVERIVLIGGASANSLNASAATVPVVLIGGPGNDTLIGGTLADTLTGGNRNDATVQAGDGADSLDGGPGADVYENDVSDTFVSGGGDTSINDVFTLLPNWVDAI